MGFNTTMVINNDSLSQIEKDKDFGQKVHDAVLRAQLGKPVDISSGGHCNVATIIESHHADGIHLIAVGGNYGKDLGWAGGYRSEPTDLLKQLADNLGYRIVRKSKRKSKGDGSKQP